MDRALLDILANRKLAPGESAGSSPPCEIDDPDAGDIHMIFADGKHPYRLKPVRELLSPEAPGENRGRVLEDDCYANIFMGLETALLGFYSENPDVEDAEVRRALNRLAKDPCDDGPGDVLLGCLRFELRMILSHEDFSRSEVVAVLRKLVRSCKMHSDVNGPKGYYLFLQWFYEKGGASGAPLPFLIDMPLPAQRPKRSKGKPGSRGKSRKRRV